MKRVQILKSYKDMEFNRQMQIGEIVEVSDERAETLVNHSSRIAKYTDEQPIEVPATVSAPADEPTDTSAPLKTEETVAKPATESKGDTEKKAAPKRKSSKK